MQEKPIMPHSTPQIPEVGCDRKRGTGVIYCAPLSVTPHFRATPNWLETTLVPLSKHFQNLTVLPTSSWPPLQAPSPVPAFWLPCSPFPTVSSPARKSGCALSAWMDPRAKSQAFQSLQSSAEAASSPRSKLYATARYGLRRLCVLHCLL